MADKGMEKPAGVWELEARLEKLEQGATKDAKMVMTFPKITPEEHGEMSRVVAMGARVRVRIAEIEPPLPMPEPTRKT